jgi:coenzyme PQQ synthesis protein D (PqqD)
MTLRLRTEGLDWKQVDDEIVILDARDAIYLTVKGSGTLLWHLLADGATREQLVTKLVESFEVDEPQAAADTDAFLEELAGKGLLAT